MNLLQRLRERIARRGEGASSEDRAESDARNSARKYWERQVADEKVRRGTPDKPRR